MSTDLKNTPSLCHSRVCEQSTEVMQPLGYSNAAINITGIVALFLGIPGMLIAGWIVDRTRAYKFVLNVCLWISGIACLWLALCAVPNQYGQVSHIFSSFFFPSHTWELKDYGRCHSAGPVHFGCAAHLYWTRCRGSSFFFVRPFLTFFLFFLVL